MKETLLRIIEEANLSEYQWSCLLRLVRVFIERCT